MVRRSMVRRNLSRKKAAVRAKAVVDDGRNRSGGRSLRPMPISHPATLPSEFPAPPPAVAFAPQLKAGLPAQAYTSPDYLEQERQTVFAQQWVCVGLASDVANPGDVYPVEVAGMPIVLVRDGRKGTGLVTGPGTLRAFHNICRHRGLQLMPKACNVQGNFRCPYHSWTYKLDGRLKNTPHFGGYYQDTHEGFDRADKGADSDSLPAVVGYGFCQFIWGRSAARRLFCSR